MGIAKPRGYKYEETEVLSEVAGELGLHLSLTMKSPHVIYPVRRKSGAHLVLNAGIFQGIPNDARFTLYQSLDALLDGSKPLGQFIGRQGQLLFHTLEPFGGNPCNLPNSCISIRTGPGLRECLRVYDPPDAPSTGALIQRRIREINEPLRARNGSDCPCFIELVSDKDEAQLEIVPAERSWGKVAFNVLDKLSTSCGFTHLPHVVDLNDEDFGRVLRSAAHYFFQLHFQALDHGIRDGVEVEFFPLEEQCDEGDEGVLMPGGENMYRKGAIEIEVDEETKYGIKISNHSRWDLQPICFYFDQANLSITPLTDVPEYYQDQYYLKKDSISLIGYGESSIPPIGFNEVPQGLDFTLGFLKFHFYRFPKGRHGYPVFSTLTIPIVQKRKLAG